MQPSSPASLDKFRKLLIIVGFVSFMFFTYKAVHDVSNTAIAEGARRSEVNAVIGKLHPSMSVLRDDKQAIFSTRIAEQKSDDNYEHRRVNNNPNSDQNNKQTTKTTPINSESILDSNVPVKLKPAKDS